MSSLDDKKRIALLEGTLREILRIDHEADIDPHGSMGFDTALDGELLKQWQRIRSRAKNLLANP